MPSLNSDRLHSKEFIALAVKCLSWVESPGTHPCERKGKGSRSGQRERSRCGQARDSLADPVGSSGTGMGQDGLCPSTEPVTGSEYDLERGLSTAEQSPGS